MITTAGINQPEITGTAPKALIQKKQLNPPPPRMHASCEEGVDPEGRFILAAQPLLTGAD